MVRFFGISVCSTEAHLTVLAGSLMRIKVRCAHSLHFVLLEGCFLYIQGLSCCR